MKTLREEIKDVVWNANMPVKPGSVRVAAFLKYCYEIADGILAVLGADAEWAIARPNFPNTPWSFFDSEAEAQTWVDEHKEPLDWYVVRRYATGWEKVGG